MDLLWLHVCLVIYSIHNAFASTKVSRGRKNDIITSAQCMKCQKHGATCVKSADCCKKCKCGAEANTFYTKTTIQSCVKDDEIEAEDDCKFYIAKEPHEQAHRRWIELPNKEKVTLGFLKHISILLYPNKYKCTVSKKQYWNLVEWKALNSNFFIDVVNKKHVIKLAFHTHETKSKFNGYLIKLQIKCDGTKPSSSIEQSCTVFKFIGEKEYDANITEPIELPTKPPTAPPPTTISHSKATTTLTVAPSKISKKSMLIFIVIAVAATLSLVIFGIVIWCCCWRKRKANGDRNRGAETLLQHGEDPNYQNPDNFPGRRSTEVNGGANNLTYLQPVDALPNNVFSKNNPPPKRTKDPNYDQPDIHLQNISMKSNYRVAVPSDSSTEMPIYAEVGDLKSPEPNYTKPNLVIPPRGGTQVVGVPGYQAPSGPCSDSGVSSSHDTYSSLGVLPGEDSTCYQSLLDQAAKPPTPQYAEVVPEGSEDFSV